MIGDRVELTHDDPESYALRVDGTVVARIDRMLVEGLQAIHKLGEPPPYLEAINAAWPKYNPETRTP